MQDVFAAISWFFSNDAIARVIGLFLWSALCMFLLPCLVRCILLRPRYLDPLFSIALALFLNRVAFGVQAFVHNDVLADLCRWTGIATGGFYLVAVIGYLKSDRA